MNSYSQPLTLMFTGLEGLIHNLDKLVTFSDRFVNFSDKFVNFSDRSVTFSDKFVNFDAGSIGVTWFPGPLKELLKETS